MVCLGEGEFPVLYLLKSLEQGSKSSSIPNLWVKQDGVIFRNDLRPLNHLDPFPFADYTEEDKYYVHAHPLQLTPYPIMTSRGCPFSCTFCCNSILRDIYKGKGKYIRRRSVENVISELLLAKSTYGISEINFLDDIFVDDRKWLSPFLEEYKQKINLPFSCYLHSHYVSEGLIQALKKAGLYTACLGIQSGDERIRREIYHRTQSNEEILRSARLLNPEIAMAYDLIVDNPFESKEGLVEAIHLLLQFPHPFRVQVVNLDLFP